MFTSKYYTTNGMVDIDVYDNNRPAYNPHSLYDIKRLVINRKFVFAHYAHNYLCLDTETSHHGEDEGWIYQWCIGFSDEDYVVAGRSVDDLVSYLKEVNDSLPPATSGTVYRTVVYIHNASYDITYMLRTMNKVFDKVETFYMTPHHLLTCRADNLEIRCSYKLSNYSLSGWGKALNTECRKMDGEIDYDVIRYPWSDLTDSDWEYQISDVMTMRECIAKTMTGYQVSNIPLTSTGFVREDCKAEAYKLRWAPEFKQYSMTTCEYETLQQTFAGGYTHANRYTTGKTLKNIKCVDITSSYPSRLAYDRYPSKRFVYSYQYLTGTWQEQVQYIHDEIDAGNGFLFTMNFKNLRIRPEITMPYISESKCYVLEDDLCDNGRVLQAFMLAIPITHVDMDIILRQYLFDDMYISDVWMAPFSQAPDWVRNVNREYFRKKCQEHRDSIEYAKSKAKLNGIYGCFAQKPVRNSVSEDAFTGDISIDEVDVEKSLDKYFAHPEKHVTVYQMAPFVTAYARKAIFDFVEIVGYEHVHYMDTDSVFTDVNPIVAMDIYNRTYIHKAKQNGVEFVDVDGNVKRLGVLELDKDCAQFRALHSKCYAYVDRSGKLKVTIAGVSAVGKDGNGDAISKSEELGSIDNLREGFTFKSCGGTRTKYNYNDKYVTVDGHELYIGNSAVIVPVEYKVTENPEIGADGLPLILWSGERAGGRRNLIDNNQLFC